MATTTTRSCPSIATEPGSLSGVLRILEHVDELPFGATGVLKFGGTGLILVQGKRICWAMASTMKPRLTDLLRHQRTPPVPREEIEKIYRACRVTNRPLGEALVASGLVSEHGLRSALIDHTGNALLNLARAKVSYAEFVPHVGAGYKPFFSFPTCELVAALGAAAAPTSAATAKSELDFAIVQECTGAAFVRHPACRGSMLVAVDRGCDLPTTELVEACTWSTGLLDVARTVDPTTSVVRAVWCSKTALVTWQRNDVGFIALCSSRAATARLVSRIEGRSQPPAGARGSPGHGVGT
jgi:hypothetical protein